MGTDLDPQYRPPAEFEPAIQAFCDRILPVVREAARKCGYAVGLHGSMVRDLDLIACPWIDEALPPAALVTAIKEALLSELGGRGAYGGWYSDKTSPHGRMWANFYFQPDVAVDTPNGVFPFIDLSIMPRLS